MCTGNQLKKRKDTLSTSERELANRIAEGEKERASRKGDEDKVAMKERDEAQKRSETKVRNKIASEERYMQEAEKKVIYYYPLLLLLLLVISLLYVLFLICFNFFL